jgi:hypothetical protein
MRVKSAAAALLLAAIAGVAGPASASPGPAPDPGLIDDTLIAGIRDWVASPVVLLTLEDRNRRNAALLQDQIDALDQQWRKERESDDQPLITAVLSSPLSSYLTKIQARSLGLYSEIFVIDSKGLNAGQSAITSDYWQGDEAKFQKTFLVGPNALFVDEPEFNEETQTWRAQVNLSIVDEQGELIGAATIEVNLTELQRRIAFEQQN